MPQSFAIVGLAQGTSVIPPEAIYGPGTKPLSPPTQITPVIHGEYNAMDTAELSPSTTLLAPLGERRGASDITTLQLQTNTLSSQLSLAQQFIRGLKRMQPVFDHLQKEHQQAIAELERAHVQFVSKDHTITAHHESSIRNLGDNHDLDAPLERTSSAKAIPVTSSPIGNSHNLPLALLLFLLTLTICMHAYRSQGGACGRNGRALGSTSSSARGYSLSSGNTTNEALAFSPSPSTHTPCLLAAEVADPIGGVTIDSPRLLVATHQSRVIYSFVLPQGNCLSLTLNPIHTTVAKLKQIISHTWGIPPSLLSLHWQGKNLDQWLRMSNNLLDIGLSQHDTIRLHPPSTVACNPGQTTKSAPSAWKTQTAKTTIPPEKPHNAPI